MKHLFREEAVEFQRPKLYGDIILDQPRSVTYVAISLLVIAALMVVFFFVVGFSRTERLEGIVMPDLGLIQVTSSQAGIVSEVYVHEGQQIPAHALLLKISGEQRAGGEIVTQRISEALSKRLTLMQQHIDGLFSRWKDKKRAQLRRARDIEEQMISLREEIAFQEKRVEIAESMEEKWSSMTSSGVVSIAMAMEKTSERLDEQIRLRNLQQTLVKLQIERRSDEEELQEFIFSIKRETSEIHRQIEGVKQEQAENELKEATEVISQHGGQVSALLVNKGQTIAPGQSLVSVVPSKAKMEVVLYAPTRAVGLLHAGMKVRLRYDAFPYQKYGQFDGVVIGLTKSPVPTSDIPHGITSGGAQMYRVRVKPLLSYVPIDGNKVPLTAGMQLEATISLEYRRLYQWAFAPFSGRARS